MLENPLFTAFVVLVGVSTLVVFLSGSYYRRPEFLENLLVAAHGLVFEIAVIGFLIVWLDRIGRRRSEIKSLHAQIDDFRDWKSPEAAYRTAGNIRRLGEHGVQRMNLRRCFLNDVNLSDLDLRGSTLAGARLHRAILVSTDLTDAALTEASLRGANLRHARLRRANLNYTELKEANLAGADLQDAALFQADLRSANLSEADLRGAVFQGADLTGAANLTMQQLATVGTLHDAKLDPSLAAEIANSRPDLLQRDVTEGAVVYVRRKL